MNARKKLEIKQSSAFGGRYRQPSVIFRRENEGVDRTHDTPSAFASPKFEFLHIALISKFQLAIVNVDALKSGKSADLLAIQ